MKRFWRNLACFSVILAALFAVGCGNTPGTGGGRGDRTQVRIWIQSTNQPDYFMGWFENAFETENPEIDLKFEPQATSTLQTNLDVSLPSDPSIDMVATWGGTVLPMLVTGNRVMDLSEVLDPLEENMEEKALLNKVGGKHYGAPIYGFTNVIYYNKTVFDQNGWQAPTTYEQFKELCSDIVALRDGSGSQRFQTTVTGYSYHVMQSLHGLTMTEEELNAILEPYSAEAPNPFASDSFINGFEWLAEMVEDNIFAQNISGYTAQTAASDFTTQKALMISCPSSDLMELSLTCQFEIGAFAWPSAPVGYAPGGVPVNTVAGVYTDVLCVNALTQHYDECKKVLQFLYSDQAQQQLLNTYQYPVIKNTSAENVDAGVLAVFDTAFKPIYDVISQNGMSLYYMVYYRDSGISANLEQGFKAIANASAADRQNQVNRVTGEIQLLWK